MPAGAVDQSKLAEYKEAFSLFDKDGDGWISVNELGTVMRALGKSPTEAEVGQIVREVDPDHRGVLDFQEFVSIMGRNIREFDNETDLRAAWKVLDSGAKGFISVGELRHMLTNVGEKLSQQEVDDLIREADPQGQGVVQHDAFIKMMMGR